MLWNEDFSVSANIIKFLISNFLHVLNVVFFLLDDSPVSVFYVPMFWNSVCSIFLYGVSLHCH